MTWINAVVQGVLLGGLYALFACGLSLMFGVMRIINLAHGDLAVLGAFLVWLLSDRRAASRRSSACCWCCRSCALVGYRPAAHGARPQPARRRARRRC